MNESRKQKIEHLKELASILTVEELKEVNAFLEKLNTQKKPKGAKEQ